MKRCRHTLWLDLDSREESYYLLSSDRLNNIANQTPYPDEQYPTLMVLIGGHKKCVALRQVFGIKKKFQKDNNTLINNSGVHLHTATSNATHEDILLVAEGGIGPTRKDIIPSTENCHRVRKHSIKSRGSSTLTLTVHDVYHRLLFPFASIFCFFSEDIGGFEGVVQCLAGWMDQCAISVSPNTFPKILIVTDKIKTGRQSESDTRDGIVRRLQEVNNAFVPWQSLIEVVALLPEESILVQSHHRYLTERLMDASDSVRISRETRNFKFSMTHFTAFMNQAFEGFAADMMEPFDFIKSSRTKNPPAQDLDRHLNNIVNNMRTPRDLMDFAAPLIASGLFLDNHPPGAHIFVPEETFDNLYRKSFLKIEKGHVLDFNNSKDVILRTGFIKEVEKYFRHSVKRLELERLFATTIHTDNLSKLQIPAYSVQNNDTCLFCMRGRPQYSILCFHNQMMCENCVVALGKYSSSDPWAFQIRHCFLCKVNLTEPLCVAVHPPTAGVGVLCIDGGGVRGVVPLKLMKRIHDRVGLSMPFQKFFKAAFGVSSGGLIVLAMFVNGWTIDESTSAFENLAKLAFKNRKIFHVPWMPRMIKFLTSYLKDGLYSAENIEAALQQVLGVDRRLLDPSYATKIGARIGLPVASIGANPSLGIFTNYNGVGQRDKDHDKIIRPGTGVKLWEVARCASAAPGYFSPKRVEDIGTYQDGGPLVNDPLIPALTEVAATFPFVEKPDYIISLGTGDPGADNNSPAPQGILRNGAIPRFLRMAWQKMNDKQTREAFHKNPRYNRLNVQLEDDMHALDDVTNMPKLQTRVDNDHTLSCAIDRIAQYVIASRFYFELDDIPKYFDGRYIGSGTIYCSITRLDEHGDKNLAFKEIFDQLLKSSAQFSVNDRLVPSKFDAKPSKYANGNFSLRVELDVAETFRVLLRNRSAEPLDISGSPFSIEKLVQAQGLDLCFGRPDHRKRGAPDQETESRKRHKRWF